MKKSTAMTNIWFGIIWMIYISTNCNFLFSANIYIGFIFYSLAYFSTVYLAQKVVVIFYKKYNNLKNLIFITGICMMIESLIMGAFLDYSTKNLEIKVAGLFIWFLTGMFILTKNKK